MNRKLLPLMPSDFYSPMNLLSEDFAGLDVTCSVSPAVPPGSACRIRTVRGYHFTFRSDEDRDRFLAALRNFFPERPWHSTVPSAAMRPMAPTRGGFTVAAPGTATSKADGSA